MSEVKTPTQALAEFNEEGKIMDFVIDYIDTHAPEFDSYISPSNLTHMIIAFKRKYVDYYWYNAGIMAQRILQNGEIEKIKHKLKIEEQNHLQTRVSWDSTIQERDAYKSENEFLRNRIKIMNAIIHPLED